MQPIKGITNLGEWATYDPQRRQMILGAGGTWTIEAGRFAEYRTKSYSEPGFLDAKGRLLTPGLIDPHTHPAFARSRELEFELRSQGKTYKEIAAAGGGIRNSVRALRSLPEDDLVELISDRFQLFLEHGTTTIECKSGYGLSPESEIKSLRALKRAGEQNALRTHRTFLGAHEIPDEYREDREAYIRLLIDEMLPQVATETLAEYCDAFCEKGVYTPEETRRIFTAAKAQGLKLRLHADEFVSTGGAELAAEMGALSADHLMAISPEGIQALAESETVATLLPGTTFFLGQTTWAPARELLDQGVTIALATDFNPGSSMTVSLPFIMSLAVIYLKMSPLEALQACTWGSAAALGITRERGAIEEGYLADAVLWDCANHRELPYFYAVNQARTVIVAGQITRGRRDS